MQQGGFVDLQFLPLSRAENGRIVMNMEVITFPMQLPTLGTVAG
jgi:hypothetical protein